MEFKEGYCKCCGIKLSYGILGMGRNVYEFEDGEYCGRCAKMKVTRERKENL